MRKYKPASLLIAMTLLILLFQGSIESGQLDSSNEISNDIYDLLYQASDEMGETIRTGEYDTYIYPVMIDCPLEPKTKIADNPPLPTMSLNDLPSQFSWKSYNGDWTTPVKDQEDCGSSWAFCALGIMEASINIASGYPDTDIDLSEQYLLSCLPYGGSCNGGSVDDALEAIMSESVSIGNGINGVPTEDCMPYQAVDWFPCLSKCGNWDRYTIPVRSDNVLWQLQMWGANHGLDNDDPNDIDIVKGYLMEYGPLATSMYVNSGVQNYWTTHHGSENWYAGNNYWWNNHVVEIVGWKDDPQVTNGGFWRLKNSWGPAFGYNGFFNVAYGGLNIGNRVRWCRTFEWPEQGPGPGEMDMAVFCDFDYGPIYPNPGNPITFYDMSEGDVTLREWDFNGDGIIDSNEKNPSHTYYEEGNYNVTLTVYNAWGLQSTRTMFVGVKERWPPQPVCNPESFVDNELEVSLDARYSYDVDGGRVVSYHWDFDDGTSSSESYVTHIFPEPDRIYQVKLTVTDDDGASASTTCVVKIDQTVPPETQLIITGAEEQEWFRFSKKIRFEADDWTSVRNTFYQVNDGGWIAYEQQNILISQEGLNEIQYYSVDFYGNEEAVQSTMVGIDKTLPILDISVQGTKFNTLDDEWFTSDVSVTLTGDDTLSGLDLIIYKVDSEPWKAYEGSFGLSDGKHRLWAYAIDKAGNRAGNDDPMKINVDTGAPNTVCLLIGEGTKDLFYQSVEVHLLSSDSGIGVDTTYYSLNNGPYHVYDESLMVFEFGDYTIHYYAVDALGNEEIVQTSTFSVLPVNFLLELEQPRDFLYFFNLELFGLSRPVIIGPIDIKVEVDCYTGEDVDISFVEFLVDGEILRIDSEAPYIWRLNIQMIGVHEIAARAVASDGGISVSSTEAQILIF
jgi:PKD repeat protein